MGETIFQLDAVHLASRTQPRLVDVSLTVRHGITAVVGPSGAGKTSLLNLLAGFEKPSCGSVVRYKATDGRLPLAWVPQDDGLWPFLTVRQHLLRVRVKGTHSERIVDELLQSFDLTSRAAAYPQTLSRGERNRVAVARALASEPAVLVMDEPLAHVDPLRRDAYWHTIATWLQAHDASLVFATHEPRLVLAFADDVVCVDQGSVIAAGDVRAVYESPATPAVAGCLGEFNWFSGDAATWLGAATEHADVCVRPERLTLDVAPHGSLVVERSATLGSVACSRLQHEPTGQRRTIWHTAAATKWTAGQRVVLRLAMVMLAALLLVGCGETGVEPTLSVSNFSDWTMPPEGPRLPAPRSVTVSDNGEIYVLDNIGRVLVFSGEVKVLRQWMMPDTTIGRPEGVCVLKDGRVIVADTHYHRMVLFTQQGDLLGTFGEHGSEPGQFVYPVAVTQDDTGNLYIAEYGRNDRVQKFTADGTFVAMVGRSGSEPGEFQRPSGIVWHKGRIYVADAVNNRVQVFTDDLKFVEVLGAAGEPVTLGFPYDVYLGPDDNLYIAEYKASRVTCLSLDGKLIGRFGGPGTGANQFRTPWGISVDASGRVLVADTGNRRIVELRL